MNATKYKTPTYAVEVRYTGPHGGATGPVETWTIINPLTKGNLKEYFRHMVSTWPAGYRMIRFRRVATRWN